MKKKIIVAGAFLAGVLALLLVSSFMAARSAFLSERVSREFGHPMEYDYALLTIDPNFRCVCWRFFCPPFEGGTMSVNVSLTGKPLTIAQGIPMEDF